MFDLQQDYLPIFYEVGSERNKQLSKEYTAAHDDKHVNFELVMGAGAFLGVCHWPWEDGAPEFPDRYTVNEAKADYRKRLIKAMAMIMAEIQRIDRID